MTLTDSFRERLQNRVNSFQGGIKKFTEFYSLKSINGILSPTRKQSPTLEKVEEICNKLGWTVYIGPPDGVSKIGCDSGDTGVAERQHTADVIGSAGCSLAAKGRKIAAPAAPLPADITDPAAYYVIATGHSMRAEGIEDGDYVLVSPARTPISGDRVYFETEPDQSCRIKRLYRISNERADLYGWSDRINLGAMRIDETIYSDHLRCLHTIVAVFSCRPGSPGAVRRSDPRHTHQVPPEMVDALQLVHGASVDDAVAAIERLTARWRELGDPASPGYTERLAQHMLDHVQRSRHAAPMK